MIEVKIIEDSCAPSGARLTTFQLAYPRFIHAELMTHRVFSRNASSSRAIPVRKLIDQVKINPACPLHWGKNQPGMQASSEVDVETQKHAKEIWLAAAASAIEQAEKMNTLGLHKQLVNRLLEPFLYISVIVSATEWENFFLLRNHADAQPEIFELAKAMKLAMERSDPRTITEPKTVPLGWHLPYVTMEERRLILDPLLLAKISAARCARVSYLTHDGIVPEMDKDLQLFSRLVGSQPLHASPVEHQAFPLATPDEWNKNFRGWYQFRTMVEQEFNT
ncbi:FAD-dependent thymidylate synthase [Janthinobacterium sp. SUN026]|uniref:FAD-dependent thymidylate synthase n=1 Tax=Janthinobacterium sp. SUN026 TaxID=3002438 RepID=UPI0025AFD27F|nr:FAD-dependent thymidylate synthase [Janthinobacterium sp. SUN026]MDN2675111.1 FAD-dependent thymidylate synthase [Janthinobacterium sp. SUN026]